MAAGKHKTAAAPLALAVGRWSLMADHGFFNAERQTTNDERPTFIPP